MAALQARLLPAARLRTARTQGQALQRQQQLEAKKHSLEIIVAKNRNGAIGTVEAFCDIALQRDHRSRQEAP